MFFNEQYRHFFRPLYGKYREGTVSCLVRLYQKLYSHEADYGYHLSKDMIIDIFAETLTDSPILDDEDSIDKNEAKTIREQASLLFRRLSSDGWLEGYKDPISLQMAYRFSSLGRKLTLPMVERQNQSLRTTQRHTRNTRNALEMYLKHQESHDLIDAFDFSEKIVSDFTDVVAEIEEKKRELVQSAKGRSDIGSAAKAFFSFMQNKFLPDIAIRLSADSVEKHRESIQNLIDGIRKLPKATRILCEQRLRSDFPILGEQYPNESVLYRLLNRIERRVNTAIELKLPEIRESINSFSRRANIVIRQLSYFSNRQDESLEKLCEKIRLASSEEQNKILNHLASTNAFAKVELIDPAQIRLREPFKKPPLETYLNHAQDLPMEEKKNQYIRARLNSAFTVSDAQTVSYLKTHLGLLQKRKSKGKDIEKTKEGQTHSSINISSLPIQSAEDFLAVSHILCAITTSDDGQKGRFELKKLDTHFQNEYVSGEDYEITFVQES